MLGMYYKPSSIFQHDVRQASTAKACQQRIDNEVPTSLPDSLPSQSAPGGASTKQPNRLQHTGVFYIEMPGIVYNESPVWIPQLVIAKVDGKSQTKEGRSWRLAS